MQSNNKFKKSLWATLILVVLTLSIAVGVSFIEGATAGDIESDIIIENTYLNQTINNITNTNSTLWNLTGTDIVNNNLGEVQIGNNLDVTGSIDGGTLSVSSGTAKGTWTSDVRLTTKNMFRGYSSTDSFTINYQGGLTSSGYIETDGEIWSKTGLYSDDYIDAEGDITGADIYSNGIQLTNFNSTGYLTQQIFPSENVTTIYSPLSYYKEGTTSGEIKISLPHTPTNAHITIELEFDSGEGFNTKGRVIMDGDVVNGEWDRSELNQLFFMLNDAPFSLANSLNTWGFSYDYTDKLKIGGGNTFITASTFENLTINILRVTISGDNTTLNWVDGWELKVYNVPWTFPQRTTGLINEQWSSSNDGAGSGLDADKLDGLTSTNFLSSHSIDQYTNFSDQANSPGMWKGTNINDSAYFPNTASGNRANIFLIGDILANGAYTHQIECKAFKDECSIRAAGTAVPTREWLGLVTDTYAYDTEFTGDHTQIGSTTTDELILESGADYTYISPTLINMSGDLIVTGNISSGNGYTGNCVNTTILNGIITGCND